MNLATNQAELVETFQGTPDGAFGVTLVDGRIEKLTLPMSSMHPTGAAELGTTLVGLLNGAFDAHMSDLLKAAAPKIAEISPHEEAVERFMERAVAEAEAAIAKSPSLQRDFDAALGQGSETSHFGRSPDGEVEATLVLGRLRRLEIDEHMLATARPADVAAAVISAVHEALSRNTVDDEGLMNSLSPEQVAKDMAELQQRVVTMEAGSL